MNKRELIINIHDYKIISSIWENRNNENILIFFNETKIDLGEEKDFFSKLSQNLKKTKNYFYQTNNEDELNSNLKVFLDSLNINEEILSKIYKSDRKIIIDDNFLEKFYYQEKKREKAQSNFKIKINDFDVERIENYKKQKVNDIKFNYLEFKIDEKVLNKIEETINEIFGLLKIEFHFFNKSFIEYALKNINNDLDYILINPNRNLINAYWLQSGQIIKNFKIDIKYNEIIEKIIKAHNFINKNEAVGLLNNYFKNYLDKHNTEIIKNILNKEIEQKTKIIFENYKENYFIPQEKFYLDNNNISLKILEENHPKENFIKLKNIFFKELFENNTNKKEVPIEILISYLNNQI